METAKVDIRRLQTLSDCINRTIEALNQVRLSVHAGNLPYATLGLQQTLGAFPNAFGNAYGIAPQIMGQVPGVIPGIAHSAPAFFNQLGGVSPLQNLAAQAALNQAALNQAAAFNPAFNNAWNNANLNGAAFNQFGQTGLGHTGVNGLNGFNSFTNDNTFVDPYTNARIAQTFPFVTWGYSPFGWPTV
jgi:hypothetical protein